MQDCRINAGMDHRWFAVLEAFPKMLGEGARLLVLVPVKRLREYDSLGHLQTECMDVSDVDQEAGDLLPALDDPKLGGSLYRVDGVAAGIGQADHLGFRSLCLEQEGGEVSGVERMLHRAQHFAS